MRQGFLKGLLTKDPKKRLTWPDLGRHPFVANHEPIHHQPRSRGHMRQMTAESDRPAYTSTPGSDRSQASPRKHDETLDAFPLPSTPLGSASERSSIQLSEGRQARQSRHSDISSTPPSRQLRSADVGPLRDSMFADDSDRTPTQSMIISRPTSTDVVSVCLSQVHVADPPPQNVWEQLAKVATLESDHELELVSAVRADQTKLKQLEKLLNSSKTAKLPVYIRATAALLHPQRLSTAAPVRV